MDNESTSQVLAQRIAEALEGLSLADIAKACGVTRQAVNGWKKDGRIDKAHLITLSRLTGKPIEYWLGGQDAVSDTDPHEEKMLLLFRALPEEKRMELLERAQSLYSKQYGGFRPASLHVHEPGATYSLDKPKN
jgi:transcriptional regulator with XRE-family HTH domain